jgi:hypothetical protein
MLQQHHTTDFSWYASMQWIFSAWEERAHFSRAEIVVVKRLPVWMAEPYRSGSGSPSIHAGKTRAAATPRLELHYPLEQPL